MALKLEIMDIKIIDGGGESANAEASDFGLRQFQSLGGGASRIGRLGMPKFVSAEAFPNLKCQRERRKNQPAYTHI